MIHQLESFVKNIVVRASLAVSPHLWNLACLPELQPQARAVPLLLRVRPDVARRARSARPAAHGAQAAAPLPCLPAARPPCASPKRSTPILMISSPSPAPTSSKA